MHEGPDLEIVGDIWHMSTGLCGEGKEVAHVSKRWIALTDRYGVQVEDDENALLYLRLCDCDRYGQSQHRIPPGIKLPVYICITGALFSRAPVCTHR